MSLKLKTYVLQKPPVIKWKNKPQTGKIFTIHIFDKELESQMFLIQQEDKTPNLKMGEVFEQILLKRRYIQMADKHMTICSTLLVIRVMQI